MHLAVSNVFFHICFQAYDQHLNMILGDVEEIITTAEIDDETYEEIVRVSKLYFHYLMFTYVLNFVNLAMVI